MKAIKFIALSTIAMLAMACDPDPITPPPPTPPTPGGDSIESVTIEEFLAKEVNSGVFYRLTGTVGVIQNDLYGNFDLTDETGTVYVYGLTDTLVPSNNQTFGSLGVEAGDVITLIGCRDEYNGEAQVGNAYLETIVSKAEKRQSTKDNPYSVAEAQLNQGGTGFVKGYIVGYYCFGAESQWIAGADTCSVNSNVLIADQAGELVYNGYMPVQLPSGDIRSILNLVDNKDNIGKEVLLYGTLTNYCGLPGIKDVSYAVIDGQEIGTEPAEVGKILFEETFYEGQGDFSIVNVILNEPMTYIWSYNEQYKQMAAGSYVDGRNYESEGWLISPAIDLSSSEAAYVSFEHSGRQYGAPFTNLTFQVSTTYASGDITESDWTQLTIPNYMTGEDTQFVPSGDIDLTNYCGNSNVRIAFKYTSTDDAGGNWYVRNVKVFEPAN